MLRYEKTMAARRQNEGAQSTQICGPTAVRLDHDLRVWDISRLGISQISAYALPSALKKASSPTSAYSGACLPANRNGRDGPHGLHAGSLLILKLRPGWSLHYAWLLAVLRITLTSNLQENGEACVSTSGDHAQSL